MNGLLYINTNIFEDNVWFQKGMKIVSAERKDKINKFKNPVSARLSLGAGVLLKIALDRNGLSNQLEKIKIGKHGKPYLEGVDFYFSLSHSGEYAICAYSDVPLGADLQKIKTTFPNHTKKILSEKEKDFLECLSEVERNEAFYRLWTRKESLVKLDGRGLRLPMQEISFVKNGDLLEHMIFNDKLLFFKDYDFFLPQYAICICCEKNSFPISAEEITEQILTIY